MRQSMSNAMKTCRFGFGILVAGLVLAAGGDEAHAGALVLELPAVLLTRQASEFGALCRRGPAQLGERTRSFDLWASEHIGVDADRHGICSRRLALPVRVLEPRPSAVHWMPQAEPVVSTPASQATADLSRLPRSYRHRFVRQMVPAPRTSRCTDADDTLASPAGTGGGFPKF